MSSSPLAISRACDTAMYCSGSSPHHRGHFGQSTSAYHSTTAALTSTTRQQTGSGRRRRRRRHIPHAQRPAEVVDRRNARERRRVNDVNAAFLTLQVHLPTAATSGTASHPDNTSCDTDSPTSGDGPGQSIKKLSKIKILHDAIDYIAQLTSILNLSAYSGDINNHCTVNGGTGNSSPQTEDNYPHIGRHDFNSGGLHVGDYPEGDMLNYRQEYGHSADHRFYYSSLLHNVGGDEELHHATFHNDSEQQVPGHYGGLFHQKQTDPHWIDPQDTNRTWYSPVPDVTSCFQQTTLVWIPAFALWAVLPLYATYLFYQKAPATPRCHLNIAKMVMGSVLAFLALLDIIIAGVRRHEGFSFPDVYFVSPAISMATFVMVLLLMELERRKGFVTSGVLFIFWVLHLFTGIINFYSHTLHLATEESISHPPAVITFYIQFTLIIIQTVLNCFSEAPNDPAQQKIYPEYRNSFISRITYHWLNSLVWTGFKKPLEESDIWQLDPRDKSLVTGPELSTAWRRELDRSNWFDKKEKATRLKRTLSRSTSVTGRVLNEIMEHEPASKPKVKVKSDRKRKEPSLFRAMAAVYGTTLLRSHLCKLACDILTFVGPLLQRELINFTIAENVEAWKGYLYAALFFLTAAINAFFFQQLYHIGLKLGARIRSAIIAEIYKKALTLSNEARRETTVGEIVNLMSVDAQRLQEVTGYLWMIWSSPLQITIAVWLLWQLLGVSVLAGLVLMFLLLPANVALATQQRKLQQGQMKHKDGRIKLMNDILNGIKVLKLYAWELSFKEKVDALRSLELSSLKKYSYMAGVGTFTWTLAPFGVMLCTITTYVLSGNELDAQTAFVALSLFNVLHFPINLLPVMISNIITANVSIKRIGRFLRQTDLDTGIVTHDDSYADAITIKDATFSWGSTDNDVPVLSNVNLAVPEGSFVAVVGEVGSGKSSLIAGILGELLKLSGSVNVQGTLAYAAQDAWIQNATLRENITFGKEFVRRKYDKILEACALKSDMDILPGGDMTEIGEKGINLSGGQRQRVSLARAAYSTSETDIFLLDDPLSAVDSHVGRHIFNKLLSKKGLLRNKTRVMVTHGLHWLQSVDLVVVLADGGISEMGSFEDLMSRDGAFARLVRTYLMDDEDDPDPDEDEEVAEVRKNMLQRVASLPTSGTVSRDSFESQVSWTRRYTGFSQRRLTTRQESRMSASSRRNTDASDMERFKRSVRETLKSKAARETEKAEGNKLIDKEKSEVGSVKMSVFLTYGRAMGLVNTAVMLLAFVFYKSLSVIANIWVSHWTSDNVFNGSLPANSSEVREARDVYLGVYGGLGLSQALFVLIYAVVAAIGFVRAAKLLHNGMLYSILRSPLAFFDTTPVGRILNRFSSDVETVDAAIPKLINTWMASFFTVCSCIVVIAYSTPIFLCVVPPLGIIYYFIQRFYIPTSRQLKRLEATSRSPIFAHFSETITGASTIRAYGQQERFTDYSNELVDKNVVYHIANMTSNRWIGFRLDLLSACVVLGAALFAVIGRDSLTGGVVGLSISYALQATTELNWIVRVTSDLESNLVSVERVKEYSELPSEAPWYVESTKPADDWPQNGGVTFSDYATRYRPGLDLVLKGIAADVPGGQRVGIVGRTGAGKSSLTLGLFRIIEGAYGSITMDGVNIADIGLHQLRSRITILPQESMMFAGTLRDNLDPLSQHKEDALYRALEKAHLLEFVSGLPEELDYDCGEGGQNLSVGQRQLVGLARAMLHKTKVLVLDEATAAVDLATDELIQKTIREEFATSTILTIAHRLNTIMDYDRIMVLDAGRVAEFASPAELVADRQGIFYSMAKDAGIITEQNTKL